MNRRAPRVAASNDTRRSARGPWAARRDAAIKAKARESGIATGRRRRRSGREHDHHHVYVVELDPAVRSLRAARAANPHRDPARPAVYVGMTGLPPEERLANHVAGYKSSYWVRRYGTRLLPELFEYLNPMPFEAAAEMERDLAADLRRQGYTVLGGH